MVGREAELSDLYTRLTQAQGGHRQVVFISEEAGIGKTALIDAFVARLHERPDLWIGHGQCIEPYGPGEPYLPLLSILGRLCQGTDGNLLKALLRQSAPSWFAHLPALLTPDEREAIQALESDVTRERMLRELAEAVEIFTADRTLILVLEDMHWSDGSTLAWLSLVARRRESARLLILATYRPEDARVRAHPLSAVIAELQPHGHAREVVLDDLSEASVAAYLTQRLGPKPWPTGLPRALRERTNGNPLFLIAVVKSCLPNRC